MRTGKDCNDDKENDITAKGDAIMLMMAVTRFTAKRCETPSKLGSGK